MSYLAYFCMRNSFCSTQPNLHLYLYFFSLFCHSPCICFFARCFLSVFLHQVAVYWTSPCKFKSILVLRSTFKYFFTLSVSMGHYGRGWLQGGGQGQKVAYKAKVVNNTKVVKNAKVFNNRVVDITSRWQWSPARWITRNLKYWVKQPRRTKKWAKGSKSQPN